MRTTHPLPYTFARSHRLLLEDSAHGLSLWLCDSSERSAQSEVTRKYGPQGLRLQHTSWGDLQERIHLAYAGGQAHGASTAADVVSEVE